MATNVSCESQDTNLTTDPLGGHQIWEVVVIVIITGPLSLVTIIGNLLVVISVQINSNLRTVNNYFLLSLAVADLILGAISMNLYTTYIIMGRWALGDLACDLWLAIDYVTSNASVMNLLVISFDRFFSVTRPLSYRAKRTPRKAKIMIVMAWAVSFVLWAPAILLWEYIVGKRTVKQGRCSIQFFSEPIITFATAIAAFYLPVTIMIVLYWRVYRETKNRSRDLPSLMGSVDRRGPVQEARWRSTYSSSNRSSISSSREIQAGESFPVRQVSRLSRETRAGTLSHQARERPTRASSNGRWEVERGDASSFSSLEEESEQGQAAARAGVFKLSDVDGPEGSGVSKAQDPGIGTTGKRSSHTRGQSSIYNPAKQPRTRKRRSIIIKEKKAAKTLSAILLAFILTWTPYNIMVLVSIFYCVPEKLWQLGYWLCYVNSTVNPVCYALCNESFQVTFKMLLLCRWDRRKWGNPKNSTPPSLRPYKSSSVV